MVEEDVSCAVVLQVGDLQAVQVANLCRLEAGVDGVHLDQRLWLLALRGSPGKLFCFVCVSGCGRTGTQPNTQWPEVCFINLALPPRDTFKIPVQVR